MSDVKDATRLCLVTPRFPQGENLDHVTTAFQSQFVVDPDENLSPFLAPGLGSFVDMRV